MAYLVPIKPLAGLGYARANQGLQRSAYALPHGALGCACSPALGQNETQIFGLTVDPTLLLAGGIALLGVFYLLGTGRPKRKATRIRRRIKRSQSQLAGLAV